jgi:hypothetical protein
MKFPELVKKFREVVHREMSSEEAARLGLARRNKVNQGAAKALTVPFKSQVLDVQAKEGSEERVDVSIGVYRRLSSTTQPWHRASRKTNNCSTVL